MTVFDWGQKKQQLLQWQDQAQAKDFWQEPISAGRLMKQIENLKNEIDQWESLKNEIRDLEKFIEEIVETQEKSEESQLASEQLDKISKEFEQYEKQKLYGGKYDRNGVILAIHAGAGGVDAQDWAEMLLRMYLRYSERKNFQAHILDESRGTEAGIKSVIFEIEGAFAYGNLKGEAGVHRLVRLSPFNADNLRQTSFALLEVIPIIKEKNQADLAESDLRIDTFRASGAGGQHVNTTDSAIRITHLPSGLVATCQSERSQKQNKEKAIQILLSRLFKKKLEQEEQEKQQLRGEFKSAEWGNQIRSYVLHPYQMIKDHRTGIETSDTEGVLSGDLDNFIEEYLLKYTK